ncbi:MAG: 3-phosphoshikimate 1-carboxyvinyltransferase [Deltaproteobacteria bacterium]|nr:3-phosphoshikimate 1-carboxyvinyltransferase [Deltaproteobacteria bacterium]
MRVTPVKGLRGETAVPGDKSISHRSIILGSIAEGTTRVNGFLWSEDNIRTLEAFRSMGVSIIDHEGGVVIEGRGLHGLCEPDDLIDAGNSGTTTRLLTGLLAGQPFFSVITGDDSLRMRPMGRVTKPLSLMGAIIHGRGGGNYAPLAIVGGELEGIDYTSEVASAQVKSAILLAGLTGSGKTTVSEPVRSRDHTERMLCAFGAEVRIDDNRVGITGGETLHGCDVSVPGDISSAAFLIVAALITSDSDLLIHGVGINPTRSGSIDLLRRMGGEIEYLNERESTNEPVADIRVKSSRLQGIDIGPEDIPGAIDEFPIISIAAAVAEGRTTIKGAAELRVKESDRIATMVKGLRAVGVNVEELPDGMVIEGGGLTGATVESYGDHRIAMAMLIAGLVAEEGVEVEGTGCIRTSFPGFMELLKGVAV